METKVEKWRGHDVRFMNINDEWCAVVDDICEALNVANSELDDSDIVKIQNADYDDCLILANELGVYDLLLKSDIPEAKSFKRWSTRVLRKLRKGVGLKPFEVFRMTEPDIQEDIDRILDTLFYDEKTGKLMQSITVAGGDVEQVEFLG